MTRVVITDGRIATAADDCVAEMLIENGRIHAKFEGFEVTGGVEKVVSRRRFVGNGSEWLGAEGWGEYVRRSASEFRDGGSGIHPSRAVARVGQD